MILWLWTDGNEFLQKLLMYAALVMFFSRQHRATALILLMYAVLSLQLAPFNEYLYTELGTGYPLMYALIDLSAVAVMHEKGSKGSSAQALILVAFVVTHLMLWLNWSGLSQVMDGSRYVVILSILVLFHLLFMIDGMRGGVRELSKMVERGGTIGNSVWTRVINFKSDRFYRKPH